MILVPGIGWGARIAIGIGSALFSLLFENKQEKIRKAKAKLREDLTAPSYEMLGKMHDQVINIFNNEILAKGVDEFWNLLAGYQFMLTRLGESQYTMASKLFSEFSDLNFKVLEEATAYKNAGSTDGVNDIPRIPGETMLVMGESSTLNTKKLSDLLGEKVLFMKPEENISDTVQNILGCEIEVDSYWLDFDTKEKKADRAYAVFPKKTVDTTAFKLAQQIAGIPIIKGD